MANQAAIRFVKQLCAAFSRFPIAQETKELYTQKLSSWRLTQAEWDKALDRLISDHADGSLPQLAEIYQHLKSQSAATASQNDFGWLCYDENGMRWAIRVKYIGGDWVQTAMHKHPGEKPEIPPGAVNVRLCPDVLENRR